MKVSFLAMFSFALSITPIILAIIRPVVGQLINVNTPGFKITLNLLIFPLLSIHSIILARLSATRMKQYKLKGQAIAMSAIVIATITFFISIYRMATLNI